jgi:hypothetical protein
MYKIDVLRRDENSNEVLVICCGEKYRITVHDLEILGLEDGDCIDEHGIEMLVEAGERLSCIKKAFDFLSYGDLSEKQLRDKLSKKFAKTLAQDVAALFVERGYVNDLDLARRYAETFYEFKNMGLSRIRNELFRRGISKENIEDAWLVEKLWFEAEKEKGEISKSAEQEFDIIREALDNFWELNLSGGVVYVDGKPVAMTVASPINSQTLDIHFEKGIMPYAFEGAYSFINNQFAKMQGVDFINREEDLGLTGLKKAKLSYYPSEILKKWDVKLLLK